MRGGTGMVLRGRTVMVFFVPWIILMYIFHGWLLEHGLLFPYIVVGMLIMGLPPLVTSLKSIVRFGKTGMRISEKVWMLQPNTTVLLTDLWPELAPMADVIAGRDASSSDRMMLRVRSESGTTRGIPYQILLIDADAPVPFIQIRLSFTGTFPGKLQLMPQIGFVIGHDQELESLDFNRKVIVYGTSLDVAYKILSPDMMLWYLELKQKPVILFDGHTAFVTYSNEQHRMTKEGALAQLDPFVHAVQHSGALERNPSVA